MNKIMIVGRLTRDPDFKEINENASVVKFTVVTESRYKKNDEYQTENTYHEVDAWNHQAKFVSNNFQKGSMIEVDGEIFNDNYEDKDGKKVYRNRIRARNVSFVMREYLDDKKEATPETVVAGADTPF